MAKKNKVERIVNNNTTLTAEDIDLLKVIVAETKIKGFAFIDPKNSIVLLNNEFVELNMDNRNSIGVATRATDKGNNYIMVNQNNIKTSVETSVTMPVHAFTIEKFDMSAVVKKENKRRGRIAKYPIDTLEVGNYFFVPVSDKLPDPVNSLAGTIVAANKRYSVETGEVRAVSRKKRNSDEIENKNVPVTRQIRKFAVYPYSQNNVSGAAVVREM